MKELLVSPAVLSSNLNCSHSETKAKQLNFGTNWLPYWVDSLGCCNLVFFCDTGLWSEPILPYDTIYTCKLIICIQLCCGCKTLKLYLYPRMWFWVYIKTFHYFRMLVSSIAFIYIYIDFGYKLFCCASIWLKDAEWDHMIYVEYMLYVFVCLLVMYKM